MHVKNLKIQSAKKSTRNSKIFWIYPRAGEIFFTFTFNNYFNYYLIIIRPGSSPQVLISFPHFFQIDEKVRHKNSLTVEGLSPDFQKHSSHITIDKVS